jgi:uncharacterized protein YggE
MRNRIVLFTSIAILAVLLSACGVAYAQTPQPPTRTLNVTGTGQVFLTPDIAYISIGVHTENKDAAEAVAANNRQAKAVADALKAAGVESKDIQTTGFSIVPQQQYDDKGTVIGILYVVDNTVYVTVRDLEKLGSLLDTAISAGANSITGIRFDVEDKDKPMSEARQIAVEKARAQAEELAKAAGVKLGPIQTISVYGGTPVPVFEGKYMGGVGGVAPEALNVPISPGQLSLTVDVNIVYEIQ